MTVASKKVVAAHYGAAPKFWYFNGCSAGGRQAMAEAQRFPDDFDGIIAGAPGLDWTGRAAQAVRIAQALDQNPAARLLQPQRQLLHRAVVEACDALDGVTDGLLENPMRCKFDPGVLQCSGAGNRRQGARNRLPERAAGGDGAAHLFGREESEDGTRDRRPSSGQRTGLDRHRMDGIGESHRVGSIPLPRVRQPVLDGAAIQCQRRHCARGGGGRQHRQRAQPECEAIHRSWRQADSVPRVERSADYSGQQRAVLRRAPSRRAAAQPR